MRFSQPVHWAEGLFLEPQHLQLSQRQALSVLPEALRLSLPVPWGLIDLKLDSEALQGRRVVISSLSAIMPDGTALSVPGNCAPEPLYVDTQGRSTEPVMVYLALPRMQLLQPNVCAKGQYSARYVLTQQELPDENTASDPVPVVLRRYNARLVTERSQENTWCYLPLCRLEFTSAEALSSGLRQDTAYMPPFMQVTASCPLLRLVSEFVFVLKNCRTQLMQDFADHGFDPNVLSGADRLRLQELSALNAFIFKAQSLLQDGACTPFALYVQLCDLLGQLSALNPLQQTEVEPYNHYDALPQFASVLKQIRNLISIRGGSEFVSREFTAVQEGVLRLDNLTDRELSGSEFYLALRFDGEQKDKASVIEEGDKFRLIDPQSFKERIRGVKLGYVRFPPQALPALSRTLWFRLQPEESRRLFAYIMEDKAMLIDYAPALFPSLQATLYCQVRTA